MSMEHKAYFFDHGAFERELRPILERALASGRTEELTGFIGANLDSLKDPYEGEPLDEDWESMVETPDAHQLGDIALTKYYEPSADEGLADEWQDIQQFLQQELGDGGAVLGVPFGPANNPFDPGKQGSYFQSEAQVKGNLARLKELAEEAEDVLEPLVDLLKRAAKARRGLYVTF